MLSKFQKNTPLSPLLFLLPLLLVTSCQKHIEEDDFSDLESVDSHKSKQERSLDQYPLASMYYQHMLKKASLTREYLVEVAQKIAAKLDVTYTIPPLKGFERTLEKINTEYGGDFKRLTDVVRGTIAANSLRELRKAIEEFKKYYTIVYTKNRFKNPLDSGYRDFCTIFYDPETNFYGEMQFHLTPLLEVKKTAHIFYEEIRSIEGKARLEQRGLTKQEEARIKYLEEKSKTLYKEAYRSVTTIK